jgi:hypothetical protein
MHSIFRVYKLLLLQDVSFFFRDSALGQRECDGAIEKMKQIIRLLDQTELAAISQTLSQRTNNSEKVRYFFQLPAKQTSIDFYFRDFWNKPTTALDKFWNESTD